MCVTNKSRHSLKEGVLLVVLVVVKIVKEGEKHLVVKVVQFRDKGRNPMRVPDKWLMPLVPRRGCLR